MNDIDKEILISPSDRRISQETMDKIMETIKNLTKDDFEQAVSDSNDASKKVREKYEALELTEEDASIKWGSSLLM